MPTVRPGLPATVTLVFGQALIATADAGSVGRVGVHRVVPGAPIKLGRPGTYLIEADTGSVAYVVQEPLSDALQNGTQFVQSARVIQHALIEGKKMAGARLTTFAAIGPAMDKLQDSLEHRAKRVMNRIEGTDARGAAVEGKAMSHLDATDAQLDQFGQYFNDVEAAVAGNGGPLADSGTPSGA